jgi:hypothetical protein
LVLLEPEKHRVFTCSKTACVKSNFQKKIDRLLASIRIEGISNSDLHRCESEWCTVNLVLLEPEKHRVFTCSKIACMKSNFQKKIDRLLASIRIEGIFNSDLHRCESEWCTVNLVLLEPEKHRVFTCSKIACMKSDFQKKIDRLLASIRIAVCHLDLFLFLFLFLFLSLFLSLFS